MNCITAWNIKWNIIQQWIRFSKIYELQRFDAERKKLSPQSTIIPFIQKAKLGDILLRLHT